MFGLSDQNEAKIHYNTPDYIIVEAGNYVLCAVTKQRILLENLKYWSVERQEAYSDGAAMMQREQEFNKA
ncbi:MAG: hypothetical protein COB24_14145 [Hyphomicrobiales bacterium]|nr:MAG: hypothetical protein COB24_14145 [Hyphomicrobiales bacterium]